MNAPVAAKWGKWGLYHSTPGVRTCIKRDEERKRRKSDYQRKKEKKKVFRMVPGQAHGTRHPT